LGRDKFDAGKDNEAVFNFIRSVITTHSGDIKSISLLERFQNSLMKIAPLYLKNMGEMKK